MDARDPLIQIQLKYLRTRNQRSAKRSSTISIYYEHFVLTKMLMKAHLLQIDIRGAVDLSDARLWPCCTFGPEWWRKPL